MNPHLLPLVAVLFIGLCLFLTVALMAPWINAFIPVS